MVGEASGDLHASYLMRAISNLDKSSQFFGVGGEKMERLNFRSLVSIKNLNVMGFFEVFKRLPYFLKLKNRVVKDIKQKKPDKLVLVDYPGFNLKLAEAIKKEIEIPIIYYISPQVWAWKEKRVLTIKKHIDSMVVLFPFEKSWYAKRGVLVHYFGHPLSELFYSFSKNFSKNTTKGVETVSLFPGSRQQELEKHLPLYKKIIKELKKTKPDLFFILKLADGASINMKKDLGLQKNYFVEKGDSFNAFMLSDFALVASGTATLEGAFSQTPLAVVYKTSWVSWFIARIFLNIKFVSLVNILNKSKLVEEFLQNRATPKVIASHIIKNLNSPSKINYENILGPLIKKNIYKNTANHIIKF